MSILNVLVNCPKGTMLPNLLMRLHMLKMHNYYVSCWIGLSEIGPQYVVQVTMNNVANYVYVSGLLMQKYQTL